MKYSRLFEYILNEAVNYDEMFKDSKQYNVIKSDRDVILVQALTHDAIRYLASPLCGGIEGKWSIASVDDRIWVDHNHNNPDERFIVAIYKYLRGANAKQLIELTRSDYGRFCDIYDVNYKDVTDDGNAAADEWLRDACGITFDELFSRSVKSKKHKPTILTSLVKNRRVKSPGHTLTPNSRGVFQLDSNCLYEPHTHLQELTTDYIAQKFEEIGRVTEPLMLELNITDYYNDGVRLEPNDFIAGFTEIVSKLHNNGPFEIWRNADGSLPESIHISPLPYKDKVKVIFHGITEEELEEEVHGFTRFFGIEYDRDKFEFEFLPN